MIFISPESHAFEYEYTFGRWYRIISQTVTDGGRLLFSWIESRRIDFRFAYLHLTLARSKSDDRFHENFDCEYLGDGAKSDNITTAVKRKSRIGFRLAYLHLTLAHSKIKVHLHFYREYLENSRTPNFVVGWPFLAIVPRRIETNRRTTSPVHYIIHVSQGLISNVTVCSGAPVPI